MYCDRRSVLDQEIEATILEGLAKESILVIDLVNAFVFKMREYKKLRDLRQHESKTFQTGVT